MKTFSKHWISSKKPNKQRKYRFNAPLSIRGDFLSAHLSKELRTKYNTRAVRLRVGDKVRIMRGQFRKQEGKVEEVNTRRIKIYVSKVEHVKRDGTKARYPIDPSNLLIVELNTDDKKRFGEHKKSDSKTPSKSKAEPKTTSENKLQSKEHADAKSESKPKAAQKAVKTTV